jgi:hypothetical protein
VAPSLITARILGMDASETACGGFLVVSLTATLIALANVVVLTSAMSVSPHDATLVAGTWHR